MAEPESHDDQLEPAYEAPAIESLGSSDRLTAMPTDGSLTLDGTTG
jgi:hypothetical protein